MWDESAKRMWGYSHLSSSCFTTPNLLLSILLSQAEPAYDYDWQTFQPWKHCLFLAVICAAAAEKKKFKKRGSEGFYSPPFPETSAKWTHWLSPACISQHCSDLKSSIQPTVCHNCLILALFFLALLLSFSPHLFLPLSVQNPVMVEPNKQQGFSCVYIHRHYFLLVPWLLICPCKLDYTWSCIKKKFCPEFWKQNWKVHKEKWKEEK